MRIFFGLDFIHLLASTRRVSGALNLAVGFWCLKKKNKQTNKKMGGGKKPKRIGNKKNN
jgi:hypothetical protein